MREEIIGKKYGNFELRYTFWQAIKNNIGKAVIFCLWQIVSILLLFVLFSIVNMCYGLKVNIIETIVYTISYGRKYIILFSLFSILSFILDCMDFSFSIEVDDETFCIKRWGLKKEVPIEDIKKIYTDYWESWNIESEREYYQKYFRITFNNHKLLSAITKIPYYEKHRVFGPIKLELIGIRKEKIDELIRFFYTNDDLLINKDMKDYKLYIDKSIDDYREELLLKLKEEKKQNLKKEIKEWNQIQVFIIVLILLMVTVSICFIKWKMKL